MEMLPPTEIDHEMRIEVTADQLISPGSPSIDDIFGDPESSPRIGDEFQVEIPPLMTKLDPFWLLQTPPPLDVYIDVDYTGDIGLAIPIVWVTDKIITSDSEDPKPKIEVSDDVIDHGKGFEGSKNSDDQMDVDFPCRHKEKPNLEQQPEANHFNPMRNVNIDFRNWHLVPGTLGDSWREDEQESFLLGLYIFGKNLVRVKRFIESKKMGDILSFYYGKFYKSERHRRWSECRKIRSRKCIHGQRIFTGWRQQELLSRLLPRIPEESKNTLLEVSKKFSEGKVSLEEYVSALKTTVGLSILVEAIGIGKGKHDLTGIVMEPIKVNQIVSARSEMPIGKACSSLTSEDIIKFLTGDFRLSKARSSDLFWEAVWPRLLARGWHSEQPKNRGYAVSKHSLVFLVPGVKKFSRRKLVKGIQYFDSLSDVLNKVASDPSLIEIEVAGAKGNRVKEEHLLEADTKSDQNGSSNHHQHCYLYPKLANCNSELVKFTVVDTSLVHGKGSSKASELRSLPINNSSSYSPASLSRETDGDNFDVQTDVPGMLQNHQDSFNPVMCNDDKSGKGVPSMLDKEMQYNLSENLIPISGNLLAKDDVDSASISTANVWAPYLVMLNGDGSGKNIKSEFSRKTKSGLTDYLSPVSKRQKINPCSFAESNWGTDASSVGPKSEEAECLFQLNSYERSPIESAEVDPFQQEKTKCALSENCFSASTASEMGLSFGHEKPCPRTFIDLNLPVPPEFETDEGFTEVADSQDDSNVMGSFFLSDLNQLPEDYHLLEASNGIADSQQPIENARRQSTRNRPLTTRALEALECGFLNTKRKGRGAKALSHENSMSRSSRGAHEGIRASMSVKTSNSGSGGTNAMGSKVGFLDEECSSNTNTVADSQFQSARLVNHMFLGVPQTVYQPEISTGKDSQSG